MLTEANINQENQQNSPSLNIQNNNMSENPSSLTPEIQNDNSKNNNSDIITILKEIPLHNLNDYYCIETSVFKKRIEKLNLQFFWIYESILEGQNTNNSNTKQTLIFPYNKLFLILFKEISLYIEEIIRLNKQLNAKNKNEKFYINKLNDYKIKEKEYYTNKQIIKALQKNFRNLEKNNEKLKNENEKLNKKLFNAKYSHFKNRNENENNNFNNKYNFRFSISNNVNNIGYKNYQKANTIFNEYYGFSNLTEHGSLTSSNSNLLSVRTYSNKNNKDKNFNINKSISKDSLKIINKDINKLINSCNRLYDKSENHTNILDKNETDYDNKNLVYLSINQCQDEINNLNQIENLLKNCIQNKDKSSNKGRNKSLENLINTPINDIKYKVINRQNLNSNNKKLLFTDKKYKKMNKSLDFKNSIILNRKKS